MTNEEIKAKAAIVEKIETIEKMRIKIAEVNKEDKTSYAVILGALGVINHLVMKQPITDLIDFANSQLDKTEDILNNTLNPGKTKK